MASYGKRDAFLNLIYNGESIALLFAEGFSPIHAYEMHSYKPLNSRIYQKKIIGQRYSFGVDVLYLDNFYAVSQYATMLDEFGRAALGQWAFGTAWAYGDDGLPVIPDMRENIATVFDYIAEHRETFDFEVIDYADSAKTLFHHVLYKNCLIESLSRNDDKAIKKNIKIVAENITSYA